MHATSFDGVEYENEDVAFRGVYEDKARAAIKAVAEWLGAQENKPMAWASIELLAELEDSE